METIRTLFTKLMMLALLACSIRASAQPQSLKSILINHGAPTCGSSAGEQELFTGTLSGAPSLLQVCNNGLPYYNVFTAYNPKDKKIYFADISTANTTKVYAMDYNLTGVISCQPATTPTYTYNYGISQLCFDENGNNLVIYNYNASTGKGRVKRIDVTSGADIGGTDKAVDFPAGQAPNSLSWGDIVFMPNGRVFMTFGNSPSILYELINFDGQGDATAVFITNIPRACFSIGYVDGNLIVAGADGAGCYYYIWDINSVVLSNSFPFPLGKSTADMTHMNVGVGAAQELIGGSVINSNTADIVYYVYLKNKGNIDIINVLLKNKLTDAFGIGNVSNAQASFVSNPAGLLLNPLYDGVTTTDLLLPGQTIPNYPVANDSAVIRITFRATNLIPNQTYYSSAIASGQAGAGLNLLQVKDSSNNGASNMIDVDNNGVSDDIGEGVPTPFMYNVLLPLSNIGFTAALHNEEVSLSWQTTNETNLKDYETERSNDGMHYTTIGTVAAKNSAQASYQFEDNVANLTSSKLYYRLRVTDNSGKYSYSNTIIVQLNGTKETVSTYPNPFVSQVNIQTVSAVNTPATITLLDATGKTIKQFHTNLVPGTNYFTMDNLASLSKGMYILEVNAGDKRNQIKIIK